MGNSICVPVMNRYKIPACAACEKQASMAYNRLSSLEKRGWIFHAGLVYCAKCMITMRINAYQEEKDEQFQARVAQLVAEKYVRRPRHDSNLRKLESGKSWHKGSDFHAPYVESPSVTKKLMRLTRPHASTTAAKESVSSVLSPSLSDNAADLSNALSNCEPLTESNVRLLEANTKATEAHPICFARKQNETRKGDKSLSAFSEARDGAIYCEVGKECVGEESSGETNNSTLLAAPGHNVEGYEDGNYLDSDFDSQSSGSSGFGEEYDGQVAEQKARKSFGDHGRFSFMLDEGPEVESIELSPLSNASLNVTSFG